MSAATFGRKLPAALYNAAGCRELDRLTIEAGTAGYELMQRAASAAFELLRQRWPQARRLLVLCGAGNNAGDGYVLARLAAEAGFSVTMVALANRDSLSGDALTACQDFSRVGEAVDWSAASLADEPFDVAVDALLGIGLSREVSGDYRQAIDWLNQASVPVLALDIPSGLSADTGHAEVAVQADVTITFIANKFGLHTARAPEFVGELWFGDLAVSQRHYAAVAPVCQQLSQSQVQHNLPGRSPSSHKGSHGHVLVIGGEHGMGGAVRLSVEAALRTGAGKVSLATRREHIPPVLVASPEAMPVEAGIGLHGKLQEATVIAIGPGLGLGEWGQSLWRSVLRKHGNKPVVVDADVLTLLAKQPQRLPANWVLTPHPGEAARLLGVSTAAIQQDRLKAVTELTEKFGAAVVLKGNGSLIATAGANASANARLCPWGNPGMASGGMGDVLTGVVAALLAQDIAEAATTAVAVHAMAADVAAKRRGERGLLARDVIAALPSVLNIARASND